MITTTILQALFNCTGNPISETVLFSEVRIMSGKRVGEMEFSTALQRIRQGGYATVAEDPLTGDSLWSITRKGSNRVEGK